MGRHRTDKEVAGACLCSLTAIAAAGALGFRPVQRRPDQRGPRAVGTPATPPSGISTDRRRTAIVLADQLALALVGPATRARQDRWWTRQEPVKDVPPSDPEA